MRIRNPVFYLLYFDPLAGEQVMEVTTPLASLPYKEQVKKKQREVDIRIRIKSMRIRNPGFYYCILILAGDGSDYTPGQPALQGADKEEAARGCSAPPAT
jgi:hypothetical protein